MKPNSAEQKQSLLGRYASKLGAVAKNALTAKVSVDFSGKQKPQPSKPKLVVQGKEAYWLNPDGTKTPYKKNLVDKFVDRALSPY